MESNHFINTLSELQEVNHSPIDGYKQLPVVTLEEATEKIISLVPDVKDYVSTAKQKCNRRSTLLTHDESAAIYLYTMPNTCFSCLNKALRAKDRRALEPWFPFLKLFMTALAKLPSHRGTVWRGVCGNVSSTFAYSCVHPLWSVNSFSMDLKVVEMYLGETGTVIAIETIHGKDISALSSVSDEQEVILMPGTYARVKSLPLGHKDCLFIIHLKEENSRSYVCELIKHEYQRHSRIQRIVNSSESYSIEQSYMNLAIVQTKEQQEKEKKLLNVHLITDIISTYAEIYDMKTNIEIETIFEECKDQKKNILVLGRAGIGKTTFCRYVAYQWVTGAIWQQYELVILIHLRNLTESRYPPLTPGTKYSLIDLIKTEYFHNGLSQEYETLLKEQLDNSEVLWLLDGYDEIVENIPSHLTYLLEQLLATPHHILTSRPYLNKLSYNVKLEIIGFTDDNIEKYVQQFFEQIKDKMDNASLQAQQLLNFLKFNPRIWGIVHIPVNLELICSLWCDTDWSKTTTTTMTAVYDNIIKWLCRRHLMKQNMPLSQMTKEYVYTHLHKELEFLESLAFNGMKSNSIILPPELLRIASKESDCSLENESDLLNIGILKSLDYKPIGTSIEADKDHYFLHLSFQEHFAARYLVKALSGVPDQKQKAIEFIKSNKYNPRFELVFTFASGLLGESDDEQSIDLFWNTLLREPLDLIGLRHLNIVISCFEEAECTKSIPQYDEAMNLIIKWINYLGYHLLFPLKRSPSLVNQPEILDTILQLYDATDSDTKLTAYRFISNLPISNLYLPLIQLHVKALDEQNGEVKRAACRALGQMGEKAATNEVINGLVILLNDTSIGVRISACYSLGQIGETAATNEVIDKLIVLHGHTHEWVRNSAHDALTKITENTATTNIISRALFLLGDTDYRATTGAYNVLAQMGEKAATSEVIDRLLVLLGDTNEGVRINAQDALTKMGEKVATSEVIDRLLVLLDDTNEEVRRSARDALGQFGKNLLTNEEINRRLALLGDTNSKIRISACNGLGWFGSKSLTSEMIDRIMVLLDDTNVEVRSSACNALGRLGSKAITSEMIDRIMVLLDDTNNGVRISACNALRRLDSKSVTSEMIDRLLLLLDDANNEIRISACNALGRLGKKSATSKVIIRFLALLGDTNNGVRISAYGAVGQMGEKAVTSEVTNRLLALLDDTNNGVRISACNALGWLGSKSVTSEMIEGLLVLLDNTNEADRRSAWDALGRFGEKSATSEVINRLLVLLGDTNNGVRISAYGAVRQMGKQSATSKVTNRLLVLLDDANNEIKISACNALGWLGKKSATSELIDRILVLLNNKNEDLKRSAWDALIRFGEKAATSEVISRLVVLLGDTNEEVRTSACNVLAQMDKQSATSEVIDQILVLLDNTNEDLRKSAWDVLGRFGEKAATSEVINRLLVLLGDTNNGVRISACNALGRFGEKSATSEVINRLLVLLDDANKEVNIWACQALGRFGEKAVTSDVINRLSVLLDDTDNKVENSAHNALEEMRRKVGTDEVKGALLNADRCKRRKSECSEKARITRNWKLPLCLSSLTADEVGRLLKYIRNDNSCYWEELSPHKCIKAFLDTNIKFWLPIILKVFVWYGYAFTLNEKTIAVHDRKGLVELSLPNTEIAEELRTYFTDWLVDPLKRSMLVGGDAMDMEDAWGHGSTHS